MNKIAGAIFALICVLLSLFVSRPFLIINSNAERIVASEDALVSSTYPNKNYGSEATAQLHTETLFYMKFLLPSGDFQISQAELQLSFTFVSGTLYLCPAASDFWSEKTITWNNRPPPIFSEKLAFSQKEDNLLVFAFNEYGRAFLSMEMRGDHILTLVMVPESGASASIDTSETMRTPPTLVFTAETAEAEIVRYEITFIVEDQVGNPLPAKVTIPQIATETCSPNGKAEFSFTAPINLQKEVTATVQVGDQLFKTTKTVTFTKNETITLTITRRFLWNFTVTYTDGTPADGILTASSPNEVIETQITHGFGQAYLLDYTYDITFSASPAVEVTTLEVKNDGAMKIIIDPTTNTATTETTSAPASTTPTIPELPWYLVPGVYIYGLIGVIFVLGLILVAVAIWKVKSKK